MDFNNAFNEMKHGEKCFRLLNDPLYEEAIYRVIWREDVWRSEKDGGYVFQRKSYRSTPWVESSVEKQHLNGQWEVVDVL